MNTDRIAENILLLKIKITKDPDAFGKLYDLYVDRIYRFAFFKTNQDTDVAQDITADVFLRTWDYIVDNRVDNFSALLYQIARNLIIDHYRKSGREVPLESQDGTVLEVSTVRNDADDSESTIDQIDRKLTMEEVKTALGRVRSEYKDVIVLRFIEELSISEIATLLDMKKGNVRVFIHRAVKALREIITSEPQKGNSKS